jgi:hypothetical protein
MKNKNITIVLIWISCIGLIAMVLFSCKEPQTIYKTEYKTIKDTLIVNGDTIIRNIEVKQDCPECTDCPECEEKTRLETRLEYRLDKRKLKAIVSMYEDSLIQARKINNSNNNRIKYVTKWKTKEVVKLAKAKERNPFNWFLIGLAIGIFTPILIRLILKR